MVRCGGVKLDDVTDELVLVLSTPSVPEGEIARSRLADEGIPVLVKGLDSPYRIGPVHLFVPVGFEVQARLILESGSEGPEGADAPDDVEAEDAAGPDERP
jgi:hypothetical protein